MKKKTGFRTKHAKRQINEKPVPEKVLGMLERRKKRLEKKIKLMEEQPVRDKKAYKKKMASKNLGLESLKKQIEDNRKLLIKELKKRMQTEPKPKVVQEVEDEIKEIEKRELFDKLRQAALEAGKKRQEQQEKELERKRNEMTFQEEYREVV
jgi:hypothetical protein